MWPYARQFVNSVPTYSHLNWLTAAKGSQFPLRMAKWTPAASCRTLWNTRGNSRLPNLFFVDCLPGVGWGGGLPTALQLSELQGDYITFHLTCNPVVGLFSSSALLTVSNQTIPYRRSKVLILGSVLYIFPWLQLVKFYPRKCCKSCLLQR